MTTPAAAPRMSVGDAARHAALVCAATATGTIGIPVLVSLANGTGWPGAGPSALLWLLSTVALQGILQFALTVRRPIIRWTQFAWRGALAPVAAIVITTSAQTPLFHLASVLYAVMSFAVIGGPVWTALFAVWLRPKHHRPVPRDVGRADAHRLGYWLLAVGAAVSIGVVAITALIDTRGGADEQCTVWGPHPDAPDAVLDESRMVTGSFSVWPVGRQCAWEGAAGTAVANSGAWGTTGLVGAGALTAIIGAAITMTTSPHRRR